MFLEASSKQQLCSQGLFQSAKILSLGMYSASTTAASVAAAAATTAAAVVAAVVLSLCCTEHRSVKLSMRLFGV
jgi:hypothetical protein